MATTTLNDLTLPNGYEEMDAETLARDILALNPDVGEDAFAHAFMLVGAPDPIPSSMATSNPDAIPE